MKKSMVMLGCAALCGAVLSAHAVESAVVGYNTVTIDKTWTILSVNFNGVNGDSLSIQDVFPYTDGCGMTKGTATTGDAIQIQTASGYDVYFLSDGNFTSKGKTTYYADRDGKWFKAATTSPATTELPPGQAFWYGSKGFAANTTPYTLTVAGAVATDATLNVTVDKPWTHIANPYPFALSLNDDIGFQSGMTKGTATTGDAIQIQTASGYDVYFLSDGNFTSKGKTTYYADRDGKWFKAATTTATTDSIPVGNGAWYGRKGAEDFTITVNNPTAAN